MTILMKATYNSVDYYLTDLGGGLYETVETEQHYFQPKISTVGKIQFRIDNVHGGRVKINLGAFSLFPDATIFPAPNTLEIISWKKLQTGMMFLFSGTAILTGIETDGLNYKMYASEPAVNLLDDAPDFGGRTNRVYPLAIGLINLEAPLPVGGTTEFKYWKASIVETVPGEGNYHIYDNGTEKTITVNDQGTEFQSITREVWINGTNIGVGKDVGDEITVTGIGTPTDYSGDYVVQGTRTNGLRIRLAGSNPYGDYTSGNAIEGTPITSVDLIAGAVVADVLFSGTGPTTTLFEFFEFAKNRLNTALSTNYTLDTSTGNDVSVSGYETEQQDLFDFMSRISAACNHWFYVDDQSETIFLGDMQADNGVLDIDEFQQFQNDPTYPNPIRSVRFDWSDKLIELDDQNYPKIVNNEQFQSVDLDRPVGKTDFQVEVYHRLVDDVETRLIASGTSIQAPLATVTIPFQIGIVPGLRINYNDTRFPSPVNISIRTRTIEYDCQTERIKVQGEVTNVMDNLFMLPNAPTIGSYGSSVETVPVNNQASQDLDNDKIDISDIVDDLNSTEIDKPLSANQGKVLNGLVQLRAPIADPTLTGIPRAPTATAGTDTTQIATTAFVNLTSLIVQNFYDENTNYQTLSGFISPNDNLPSTSDGQQILSRAITPENSANIILVDVVVNASAKFAGTIAAALFRDSTCIAVSSQSVEGTQNHGNMCIHFEEMTSNTVSRTYSVRVGASSTSYINGTESGRKYGGGQKCTMSVAEITSG